MRIGVLQAALARLCRSDRLEPSLAAGRGRRQRRPALEYVGIDVHKKQSQLCTFTATGESLPQRLETHRERVAAVFAGRPTAHILLEASTESAWVAQCLEALGHEGIV